jgi:hypothetical protein
VATLRHRYRGLRSSCRIYLHSEGEDSTDRSAAPDITVRGDLSGRRYSFLMAGRTIAQVLGCNGYTNHTTVQVQRGSEQSTYMLEIGPWVDIAFLTVCTAAIDLLQARARLSASEHLVWGLAACPCSPCRRQEEEEEEEMGEEDYDDEEDEEKEEEDIFNFD